MTAFIFMPTQVVFSQTHLVTLIVALMVPIFAMWFGELWKRCSIQVRRMFTAFLIAVAPTSALHVVTQIYISCEGWNRFLIECWF